MLACLVLAHDQPRHAGRLVRRLAEGPRTHVFLHVDAKAEAAPFAEAVAGLARVTLLDARQRVEWGGFSVVEATLALLRAARRQGGFETYALLSGSDYVLTDAARREATLLGLDGPLIALEHTFDRPEHAESRGFWRRYHFHDTPLYPALVRAGYLLPRRRYPRGFVPTKGSQWWALPEACAACIEQTLAERPDFLRFHRRTHAPDEFFFHSLVAASPFAARARSLGTGPPETFGAHALDWRQGGRSPRTLTLADAPALLASGALFCRKVREGPSDALLDALDRATT